MAAVTVSESSKTDFQSHFLHLQQGFSIASRVVDGVVSVLRLSKMLEGHKCVFLHALVQRPEICRTEAKWIAAGEVVEVPVDELPIKSIVVRDEHHASLAVGL